MKPAIEVEARFDPDGRITPLAFTLDGRRHTIVDRGRTWADTNGRHFLVTVPPNRIFRLTFHPPTGTWTAERLTRPTVA